MANFNKVVLLGNLTRDVEVRYTQGGLPIGKFGMAINRKFKSGEEAKESTCFVDLTAFGKQAEVLSEYTGKGSPLFVEGRLEYSTWEAKDGGGKRSKLEVIVENFQFLGGGKGAGDNKPKAQSTSAPPATAGAKAGAPESHPDYGDIPF
jgi:single-strand DNA-binding protein